MSKSYNLYVFKNSAHLKECCKVGYSSEYIKWKGIGGIKGKRERKEFVMNRGEVIFIKT